MIIVAISLIFIFNVGVLLIVWRQYDYAKANLKLLGRQGYEMVKILRNDADKPAKAFDIAKRRESSCQK